MNPGETKTYKVYAKVYSLAKENILKLKDQLN